MHATPGCVTVNVCPPIVIALLRASELVFAAAVNATDPLPDPLAPEVMVIHESVAAAVQLQPDGAVTVMLPLPPPVDTVNDVGEIV